jgi:hypothetical protein
MATTSRIGPTAEQTRLDNLVLLCRHHHRLLHEGGYYVVKDGADFIFCRGDGEMIQPKNDTALSMLVARAARTHGANVGGWAKGLGP